MDVIKKNNLTAVGTANYPYLTKPDTEYNTDGVYHVKLKITKAEAQKDIKIVNDIISSEVAKEHKAKPGNTGLIKRASLPYVIEGDDVTFKFKTKYKPRLYEKSGGPFPEDKSIWNGTTMRVSYQPSGYNQAIGVGCTLRLVYCQIDNLVEGTTNDRVEPIGEVKNA